MRECLESVAWADEILMADSGSTDGTIAIGRDQGARVIEREYVNSADFKNWAIPQAIHEWVLVIDSDERCTPELRDEILKVLQRPAHDGYRIRRRSFFLGREIKHAGWDTDDPLRLFRRDISRYEPRHVHADVIVETGKVGRLRAKFLHYTYDSVTQYLRKMNRYATWSALDLKARGKRPSVVNLVLRPWIRFIKMYFIRAGFMDGRAGLVLCLLSSCTVFTKYAKLWGMTSGGATETDPETQS